MHFRCEDLRDAGIVRSDSVTLTIDAAFSATGECAGPDTRQLWDQIVATAEMHPQVAAIARAGVASGFSADRILAGVEEITGVAADTPPPPPPPPSHRDRHDHTGWVRWELARRIAEMRRRFGDVN